MNEILAWRKGQFVDSRTDWAWRRPVKFTSVSYLVIQTLNIVPYKKLNGTACASLNSH